MKEQVLLPLINVALRLFLFFEKYSRPYAISKDPTFLYFRKKLKNLYIALLKFQAIRLLGLDIFSRPYGYLQVATVCLLEQGLLLW